MKRYTMLKTCKGSRDSLTVDVFTEGETYELPADLAEQFYHEAAIKEVGGDAGGAHLREGARNRSTKVTSPTETKVTGPTETKEGEAGVPLGTQHVEELVSLARDTYGLDVDSTMDVATLRQLIEQAQADEDADGDEADLTKLTKKELVARAKTLGLELDESARKDDLIAAIDAHTAA